MRKFSSYGPINTALHFYTPRQQLIDSIYSELTGSESDENGHYSTVWSPRQTGKTWLMQQVAQKIKKQGLFKTAIITMQSAKEAKTDADLLKLFVSNLKNRFGCDFPPITSWQELPELFTAKYFDKPLILIIDEFDAIGEQFINRFVNQFRAIYTDRLNETDKKGVAKTYLLHGLALIGVRSVLGIEDITGSPFNIQRSLHIPNLTFAEIEGMFNWYERESGQMVEPAVVERLFYELQGQPGLSCWFGELLTETYNKGTDSPITTADFEEVYAAAAKVLPNNNILNIISKARQEPYKQLVLELFKTDRKIEFRYNDKNINYLYLNGVVIWEKEGATDYYMKFPCPYIQKQLFDYFSAELFGAIENLYEPFENLDDTITENNLYITNLLRRYEKYLRKNRAWLLKDAPRRKTDLRIYEAVYHFSLYMYLQQFIKPRGGQVMPEFPTGNGKVDLIIRYSGQLYSLEVKSFTSHTGYKKALEQAAQYGRQLQLDEIWLVFFVEYVDETNRQKYEAVYIDKETGIVVNPVFVEIGNDDH